MRVLHIGKFYPPFAGGIEHFLADLLPALTRREVEAAALVHDHRRRLFGRRPAAAEPPVYRAPCYGSLIYAPVSPSFPLWLARAIREFKPQLLHLHLPNTSALWTLLVANARRLPWVVHWHSDVVATRLDPRLATAYRFYRPIEQRLLARCQAVIATSQPYLEASEALQPWRYKCHTIALGLDPERIAQPSPAALADAIRRWPSGSCRLLAVGRLTHYKGHDVLIQALAAAPPEASLLIVGDGDWRSRLAALIDRLALCQRVRLLGIQPAARLRALLASCDILCLPSTERSEAFGLVLLEAMRFGKPVVASDIPGSGVGWVVRQAGHGLLVEPSNPKALARRLAELASEPLTRQRFGQRGAQALADHFHIDRIAAQILALYKTIR